MILSDSSTDDQQIVRRILAGDPDLFGSVWRHHERWLRRVTGRHVPNHDDLEDVLQQTALKAWAGLARFRGEGSLLAWLTRIAVNEARDRRRHAMRGRLVLRQADLSKDKEQRPSGEDATSAPSALERTLRQEEDSKLRRLVNGLPPALRVAVEEIDFQQKSIKQAAGQLSISETALKLRRLRAIRYLRAAWEAECAGNRKLVPVASLSDPRSQRAGRSF